MSKNRTAPKLTSGSIAAAFWKFVEKNAMVKQDKVFIPVAESKYYGIRPTDQIALTVGDQLITTDVTNLWRQFCVKNSISTDLVLASQEAVELGLLRSSQRRASTVDAATGKRRSFGVQFWTLQNPVYLAKQADPSKAQIGAAALIDALTAE